MSQDLASAPAEKTPTVHPAQTLECRMPRPVEKVPVGLCNMRKVPFPLKNPPSPFSLPDTVGLQSVISVRMDQWRPSGNLHKATWFLCPNMTVLQDVCAGTSPHKTKARKGAVAGLWVQRRQGSEGAPSPASLSLSLGVLCLCFLFLL